MSDDATRTVSRRKVLKSVPSTLALAGGLSAAPAASASATGEGIEISNGPLTVRMGTDLSSVRQPNYVDELRFDGDTYTRSVSMVPRVDGTDDALQFTRMLGTNDIETADAVAGRYTGRFEARGHVADVQPTVLLPKGSTSGLVHLRMFNAGDSEFTVNTPGHYVGTDVGMGDLKLTDPGPNYRFAVSGRGSTSFDDVSRWTAFPFADSPPAVAALDEDRSIGLGFLGGSSEANLAMTEGKAGDPEQIRLFAERVTLAPGETADWTLAFGVGLGGDGYRAMFDAFGSFDGSRLPLCDEPNVVGFADADADCAVSTGELSDAVVDWVDGRFTTRNLQTIVSAWASSS